MYIFRIFAGTLITFIGIIFSFLPIPFGIILIIVGAALLSPYVPFIKKYCNKLEAKYGTPREMWMKFKTYFKSNSKLS